MNMFLYFQEGQNIVFNWFSIPEEADPTDVEIERKPICSKGSSCSPDGGKAEVSLKKTALSKSHFIFIRNCLTVEIKVFQLHHLMRELKL